MTINLNTIKNAKTFTTILAVTFLLFCFLSFLIFSALSRNDHADAAFENENISSPTPQVAPLLSPTPEQIEVKYVIEYFGEPNQVSLQLWYTENSDEDNEIKRIPLSNGIPVTETLQFAPNTFIQFSAILESGSGKLTCLIYQNNHLIEQNTKEGRAPRVNCSGLISQE